MNVTIVVPEGTIYHGSQNLLCVQPSWRDYLTFFIVNYGIHAATIASWPGATLIETIYAILDALFLPGTGAIRAISRLRTHAGAIRHDELRGAAKAGALVMVIKQKRFPFGSFFLTPGWTLLEAESQQPLRKLKRE